MRVVVICGQPPHIEEHVVDLNYTASRSMHQLCNLVSFVADSSQIYPRSSSSALCLDRIDTPVGRSTRPFYIRVLSHLPFTHTVLVFCRPGRIQSCSTFDADFVQIDPLVGLTPSAGMSHLVS